MIKRLIPYFLTLFFGLALGTAYAQDTTKKAADEKSAVTNPVAAKVKSANHLHKLKPAVGPANIVAAPADTTKTVPQKSQIDPAQLNAKSLNGQYQYLLTKTYNYQQPLIAALWKNFTDSLGETRTRLKAMQAKSAVQAKLVDSLKAASSSKEQSLSESNAKADAISVFGIVMSKSNYNLVMFGSVVVLAIALVIVVATTAKHKHEAKYRTELYEEVEEEFKAFKAKAHEKELKLARELQTERNKVDELMGRG